ncbi:hypothetical protein C8F01DRAFT_1376375 [Mycena amicta]|nr:hypothetical protein C8F01DRAFT_1376375 [Mycena amicta]
MLIVAEREAVQHYGGYRGQAKAVRDAAASDIVASRVVGSLFPRSLELRAGIEPVSRPSKLLTPRSYSELEDSLKLERRRAELWDGSELSSARIRVRAPSSNGQLFRNLLAWVRFVETCHILNESVLQYCNTKPGDDIGDDENPQQALRQNAGPALVILQRFGLDDVVDSERLMTIGVHDLCNIRVLSLDSHLYIAFRILAFEPVADQPHTYDVVFPCPMHTFKKAGGGLNQLPFPEPCLWALHAVCFPVAHMSGAAKALDDLDQ